jgi:hypothetical protein
MPESSSPAPLPAPQPGNNPNAKSAPAKSKRRAPSDLNQEQVQAVNRDKVVVLTAQEPALAAKLELETVTPAFVATLLADIEAALNRGSLAVCKTEQKEGATLDIQDSAEALVLKLRVAQAKARQAYFHSNPAKLGDYFIGERIDANRGTLDQVAQGVVTRLEEDRPAGANTDFISSVKTTRQKFVQDLQKQSSAGGGAMTERELRDAAVLSIHQRTQLIQFAADAAWPAGVAGHGGIRHRLRLPQDRPFTA